jgi:soluble lytic murein transglycosylase-like protein
LSRNILIAICLAGLISESAIASEDIYRCRQKNGREDITNTPAPYRAQGARCHVMMKLDGPRSDSKKAATKSTSRKRRAYTPRAKSKTTPRPVQEPTSAQDRFALYAPYVREAAQTYALPESFIRAVMRVESSFKYKAVSSAGAQGLMQLMPGTAREMGVHDSFDPRQNIMGGSKLLRVLANRFDGDFAKVLSAYHAGSNAVKTKGGIPYEATEGYVGAVMDHYYRYKSEDPG